MVKLASARASLFAALISTSVVFTTAPLVAAPASNAPASAIATAGSAILMGVAVAAATQSTDQQAADRAALKKRLRWLIDHRSYNTPLVDDDFSRVVRVVFDVGPDGRPVNVRVGKRSGNRFTDRAAMTMISRFDRLPGGERHRVCTILQYPRTGQDPTEISYTKAMTAAEASAIADLRAGRDGPQYDRHGHMIV